jgi:hypothetical protein
MAFVSLDKIHWLWCVGILDLIIILNIVWCYHLTIAILLLYYSANGQSIVQQIFDFIYLYIQQGLDHH